MSAALSVARSVRSATVDPVSRVFSPAVCIASFVFSLALAAAWRVLSPMLSTALSVFWAMVEPAARRRSPAPSRPVFSATVAAAALVLSTAVAATSFVLSTAFEAAARVLSAARSVAFSARLAMVVTLPLLSTRQPAVAPPVACSHLATAAALAGSLVSVLAIRPALPLAPRAVEPSRPALASASAAVCTDLALSMQLSLSAPLFASHFSLARS